MQKKIVRWSISLIFLLSLAGNAIGSDSHNVKRQTVAHAQELTVDRLNLPLSFVPNKGQVAVPVHFQAHSLGGTIFFSPTEVVLSLPIATSTKIANGIVRMQFEAADPTVVIEAAASLPGVVNYLVGDTPATWQTNVPTYSGLFYRQLYQGIDLHYEGNMQALKGTYVVAPGADPNRIHWHYAGAENIRLDPISGDLLITLPGSAGVLPHLIEQAPIAWQQIDGQRIPVDIHYALVTNPQSPPSLGFTVGIYDHTQPLIIDPYLVYSSLIGGLNEEEGRDIAVDSAGNIYLTGTTLSTDFPQAGLPQATYDGPPSGSFGDAFIAKLNPTGTALLYMTYLGGSGADVGDAITLDPAGNAYVTGLTESTNFPTTANAYQQTQVAQNCSTPPCADAFVTKLNPAGNALVFSTYLSGNKEENAALIDVGNRDTAAGIAVDSAGNVYVTGNTNSTNFPAKNAAFASLSGLADIFVTKLQPNGQDILYSSLIGGSGADRSGDIAVDNTGNAYVVGFSRSTNFPTKNAIKASKAELLADVVLAQFDTTQSGANSRIFSTYFGGSDDDYALGIALDDSGNIVIGGYTRSTDFPTQNAYQSANAGASSAFKRDAFVTKFNSTASTLLYSTYLGGSSDDLGYDLALDAQGKAYLTGVTISNDFPTREPWQSQRAGVRDTFVSKFDPTKSGDTSLLYSTFFGSPKEDYAYGIAVDSENNPYITGIGDGEVVNDYPISSEIGPHHSGNGVLVAKFGPQPVAAPMTYIYLPLVIK